MAKKSEILDALRSIHPRLEDYSLHFQVTEDGTENRIAECRVGGLTDIQGMLEMFDAVLDNATGVSVCTEGIAGEWRVTLYSDAPEPEILSGGGRMWRKTPGMVAL